MESPTENANRKAGMLDSIENFKRKGNETTAEFANRFDGPVTKYLHKEESILKSLVRSGK